MNNDEIIEKYFPELDGRDAYEFPTTDQIENALKEARRDEGKKLKEEYMSKEDVEEMLEELIKDIKSKESQKELQAKMEQILKPFFLKYKNSILTTLKEKVEKLKDHRGKDSIPSLVRVYKQEVLELVEGMKK